MIILGIEPISSTPILQKSTNTKMQSIIWILLQNKEKNSDTGRED